MRNLGIIIIIDNLKWIKNYLQFKSKMNNSFPSSWIQCDIATRARKTEDILWVKKLVQCTRCLSEYELQFEYEIGSLFDMYCSGFHTDVIIQFV